MPEESVENLKERFKNLDATLQGVEPEDPRKGDINYIKVNRADVNDWMKCPICGSGNIANNDHEWWSSRTIAHEAECHDCDHIWWEVYEATHREERT